MNSIIKSSFVLYSEEEAIYNSLDSRSSWGLRSEIWGTDSKN